MMSVAINTIISVSKYLKDMHGGKIWFGIDKYNTYVKPREKNRDEFKVSPFPFYHSEQVLDKEVDS
jgi:hypothetical protein